MNTVLVKQEWRDPCWQDNLNNCSTTPTHSTEVPAQEKYIAKVQRTSGKALTTRPIDKLFVLMQDS